MLGIFINDHTGFRHTCIVTGKGAMVYWWDQSQTSHNQACTVPVKCDLSVANWAWCHPFSSLR